MTSEQKWKETLTDDPGSKELGTPLTTGQGNTSMNEKDDAYWKERLTDEQFKILREKGTEPAFSGEYVKHHEEGMYRCAACGTELFASDAKFDSDTGWPSFDQALPGAVEYHEDNSHGMKRTEVTCAKCGGHLGHIFDDGPTDTTGKRLCINSCSLDFDKSQS